MTRKPFLIAPLTVVLCAFALGDVAASIHSEAIDTERSASARAPTVSLAEGPPSMPRCTGGTLVGKRCLCPPGTLYRSGDCVSPPPPPKKMSPSLKPALPGTPMKPRPLCTGGKVLVGGNCVCPQGTVELSGRCVPRLTR